MKELIFKKDAINKIMSVPDGNWKSERYAKEIEKIPSVQSEIILCKDCRYSEYDFIFHSRYCHNKGKAEIVGDNFFCAAGRYMTNGSDR